MAAEDLAFDDGSNGKAVETVRECFPELDAVSPLALVEEAVYAIDAGTLVVAAQQVDPVRVLNLVAVVWRRPGDV